MMLSNRNMETDMDIVHVVMNVHEYINVCQGFLPYPNEHHQVRQFESPLPLLLLMHSRCTWKVVTGRHLCAAALVVYCQGMRSHLLECHHHLQKNSRLNICIQVCSVILWCCMVWLGLCQKTHSQHWKHDESWRFF